jgi:UDP-glucose 4-epimerase
VIHLAANKSVSHSLTSPLENIYDNLTPLLSLLTLMREEGINNLIFSSSAAVYGNVPIEEQPIKESAQLCPTNAYGAAKSWCEDAIRLEIASRRFLGLTPLKTVVMRYFNVVGVFGNSQDLSEDGLFSAIRRFYRTNETLKIHGNGFQTKDGTAVRDYISLEDLVEAHLLLVEKWDQITNFYSTYNLSTNNPSTVLDVIREFGIQSSKEIAVEFQPERSGEIPYSQGDNSQFRNDFLWVPKNNMEKIVGELLKTY